MTLIALLDTINALAVPSLNVMLCMLTQPCSGLQVIGNAKHWAPCVDITNDKSIEEQRPQPIKLDNAAESGCCDVLNLTVCKRYICGLAESQQGLVGTRRMRQEVHTCIRNNLLKLCYPVTTQWSSETLVLASQRYRTTVYKGRQLQPVRAGHL